MLADEMPEVGVQADLNAEAKGEQHDEIPEFCKLLERKIRA
jgi:hypothetical protein